jgi:hypothetical protein
MTTAYSEDTQTRYDTWDDLVEAEANGWVVVAIIKDGKQEWPWIVGPFATKQEASNARVRARTKWNREGYRHEHSPNSTAKFFVRPAWKDIRAKA